MMDSLTFRSALSAQLHLITYRHAFFSLLKKRKEKGDRGKGSKRLNCVRVNQETSQTFEEHTCHYKLTISAARYSSFLSHTVGRMPY